MADFSSQLYGDAPKKRDFGAELYGDDPQKEVYSDPIPSIFPNSWQDTGADIASGVGNLAAGALRGAGSILLVLFFFALVQARFALLLQRSFSGFAFGLPFSINFLAFLF